MNYYEAVNFITKESAVGSKYGLKRIKQLLSLLGHPEKKLKLIHITGTNGKGSTARMTAGILTAAGYRTGCFSSPFISRINEYMLIDNKVCTDEEYVYETERVKLAAESMEDKPTEFELSFAMTINYFTHKNVDIAVIEAGLGGEHDATNVIPSPEVAVITNIGLDHVKLLGNSLELIAAEKSGIIKPGCDVICYPSNKEAIEVILKRCKDMGCSTVIASAGSNNVNTDNQNSYDPDYSGLRVIHISEEMSCIDYKSYKNLLVGLPGLYQTRNAAVVLEVIEALRHRGFNISENSVREGMKSAKWPARFEKLNKEPLVIADGGHNKQCIEALIETLREIRHNRRVIFVIGVMADKDYMTMFELIKPYASYVIATRPANPRALDEESIKEIWMNMGIEAEAVREPSKAVIRAMNLADINSMVCVSGSLYMMGEIRAVFKKV